MTFFNLHDARDLIVRDFTKNPRRSLSAYFRYLRSRDDMAVFGDYPLMHYLLQVCKDLGIIMSRGQIYRMISNSEELLAGGEGIVEIKKTLLDFSS